ncbi:hypothetical protein SAMN05421823_102132 [Catalinimonas alkaloidigena]|uniref:Uncharacterized protein n=1 Tax=Catalinimonas alkaloidigena TaxID=1075417 RepID=A0A1G8ZZ13_9BACT|nr:hypothetical protein [Catalinimonas alkaloidigena]SDK20338.1 hypothetical protein SAMN05421823_102132 [Catalinimonas alkaloidigena]
MSEGVSKIIWATVFAILLDVETYVVNQLIFNHLIDDQQHSSIFVGGYLLSHLILSTLILVITKRLGVFNTSRSAFLKFLTFSLICLVAFFLSPLVWEIFWGIAYFTPLNINWGKLFSGYLWLVAVKYSTVCMVAVFYGLRARAKSKLHPEKELERYGREVPGVVYQKRRHRHLWLVQAAYYVKGQRFETTSLIDRENILTENDKITILYSVRNPQLAKIKELASHD